jgi:hypothetical protein
MRKRLSIADILACSVPIGKQRTSVLLTLLYGLMHKTLDQTSLPRVK